jgi:uncharacterized protein (DUF927 family)
VASEVATYLFQKLFIDYNGKFLQREAVNTMLLFCADSFSKTVWLTPVREAASLPATRVLKDLVFLNFLILSVLSDYARCFTSHEFQQFCFDQDNKHNTTILYYLQQSHAKCFNTIYTPQIAYTVNFKYSGKKD